MTPQFLTVRINRGCDHCEECGMFEYAKCSLHFSDGFVQRGQFTDHLSSRQSWSGDLQDVYLAALMRFGYSIKVSRDGALQDPPNLTSTLLWLPDAFFEGWAQLPLELKLHVGTETGSTRSRVTLPALEGAAEVVLDYAGTLCTDEWTAIYKTLIEQRATLRFHEEQDPYFEPAPTDW